MARAVWKGPFVEESLMKKENKTPKKKKKENKKTILI